MSNDWIGTAEVPEGHGVICVLDATGDTKTQWDPNNVEEVEHARSTFNKFVKEKKYAAFSVKKNGDQDKKITEFDPAAGMMILVPQIAGGRA